MGGCGISEAPRVSQVVRSASSQPRSLAVLNFDASSSASDQSARKACPPQLDWIRESELSRMK